jgi:acyl carrier protein
MGLDVVELLITIEERYELHIPDADARVMRSVGDLQQYIVSHAQPTPKPDEVLAWLQQTIAKDFGVRIERVTPDAWIVRDLGIN